MVLASPAGAQQITFSNIILDHPFPQDYDYFGFAVASAGDLNGDGVPDVLVGAPGHDVGGNSAQGQAYVFSGTDGSLLRTLNHPNPPGGAFGQALAGVGDVNGDGVADLLVAAPYQPVGANTYQGEAYVLSGADGTQLRRLTHPNPQGYSFFGGTVAGLGDINSDGVPDLLVAASGQNIGTITDQGQVYLFSGADGSLVRTLDDPNGAGQFFGDAMADVGDINDDGVTDLAVCAQAQDAGGNSAQGRVFVFSGASGSLLRTLDHPIPQANARFGFRLAAAGDVNGDGETDLLVSAPYQNVTGNGPEGQAYVLSGANGSLLRTLTPPNPQVPGRFGEAVAGVGDANGDGIADLLVGANGQDVGANANQGQAYLYSGADGTLLRTLDDPSPQVGARFGAALAGLGDVNGDGLADLVVAAPHKNVSAGFAEGQAALFVSVINVSGQVSISPGSATAAINVNANGVITVGILSSTTLDATTIVLATVKFGPAGAMEAHNRLHLDALNGDSLPDAILHFRTQDSGLTTLDTQACIRFTTTSGASFYGCGAIQAR